MTVHRRLLTFLFFVALCVNGALAVYEDSEVFGTTSVRIHALGERSSRTSETELGNLTADAVAAATSADIVVLNGGDFTSDLSGGAITWGSICSAIGTDRDISVISISPSLLRDMLEAGVSHIEMTESETINHSLTEYGGFPQISGFRFQYDASVPPGERIMSITLESGERLDLSDEDESLTLAATGYALSGRYGYPMLSGAAPAGITLREALAEYVQAQGTISPPKIYRRISIAGAYEVTILSFFPLPLWLIVIAIFGIFNGSKFRRAMSFER